MTTVKNLAFDYLDNFEAMLYGERVAYAIEAKGVSKAWVAEKLGITKQALNYLIKHAIKPKFIDEFAEILDLDPKWLETGIGAASLKMRKSKPNPLTISSKAELLGQVGASGTETIDFSCPDSSKCIAFKLEDHSNFPPFIENSILIFNTKKVPANEDYVLVIINNDVYVRQYVKDGENICYKANNDAHKTFINPMAAKILGILVEARYKI